ncbi:MAG: hypothetical protein D6776_04895 [Planctomycetota bacterium]|nr:MAG: hypothetical protein D6776_04895 [Planctomycetota bacterium]
MRIPSSSCWVAVAVLGLSGCLFRATPAAPVADMARAPAETPHDPPDARNELTALERLEQLLRDNARLQADADRAERMLATERKRNATLASTVRQLEAERDALRRRLEQTQHALERMRAEHEQVLGTLLTERLARVRLEQQFVQRQLEALQPRSERSEP